MRFYQQVAALALSIVIAYLSLYYTSFAAMGIIAAIPLYLFRPLRSFIAGLIIGLVSSLSLYSFYPLSKVSQLASILGNISGLPSILVILLYPLLFAMMTAFSGAMWSELVLEIRKRRTRSVSSAGATSS
ncbi:MAG: hypothetical protein QXV32_06995 [Conexivisphaerales archaeon]